MYESTNNNNDFSWFSSSSDVYAPPPPEFSTDYEYGLADALNFCTHSADVTAPPVAPSQSPLPRRESVASYSELCDGPINHGTGGVLGGDGFEETFVNFQQRDEPPQWFEDQCDMRGHSGPGETFDDDNINMNMVDAAPPGRLLAAGGARGSRPGGMDEDGCFGYARFATPARSENHLHAGYQQKQQQQHSSPNSAHNGRGTGGGGCGAGWNNSRDHQTARGAGRSSLDNRGNEYNYWDPHGLIAMQAKQHFGDARTSSILPDI